jgi:hypothetical protein
MMGIVINNHHPCDFSFHLKATLDTSKGTQSFLYLRKWDSELTSNRNHGERIERIVAPRKIESEFTKVLTSMPDFTVSP